MEANDHVSVIADDLLATTAEIARWLGIKEERARRLCRDRAIPAFRLGAKLFGMRKSTFLAWLAEKEHTARDEIDFRDGLREERDAGAEIVAIVARDPELAAAWVERQ